MITTTLFTVLSKDRAKVLRCGWRYGSRDRWLAVERAVFDDSGRQNQAAFYVHEANAIVAAREVGGDVAEHGKASRLPWTHNVALPSTDAPLLTGGGTP